MITKIPKGKNEVIAVFGNPVGVNGELNQKWYKENIIEAKLPYPMKLAWDLSKTVTTVQIHRKIEPNLTAALNCVLNEARKIIKKQYGENKNSTFYDQKVKELLSDLGLDRYGGAFAFRNKRNTTSKLSTHAWGIAIDINPEENPMGSKGKMPVWFIKCFSDNYFIWGGDWKGKGKDPMHFQLCDY